MTEYQRAAVAFDNLTAFMVKAEGLLRVGGGELQRLISVSKHCASAEEKKFLDAAKEYVHYLGLEEPVT